MSVILITSDLMVVSHVQGAAAKMGVTVHTTADAHQAAAQCQNSHTEMLIVDLATPSLDVAVLVKHCKADEPTAPRIVAFGPHVHEDRLEAARQAGCDQVISRGQFFSQVEAVLCS